MRVCLRLHSLYFISQEIKPRKPQAKHTHTKMAHLPSSTSKSKPHIVMFPFMSKGHTIPLLHLAQLLHHRGVDITIFTTPANHPFIAQSLPGAIASIVDLPFPDNIQGIPGGVESTDKLPSITSMFIPFVVGLKSMQTAFEQELQKLHPHITCIISDGFLYWTLEPASRLGIPRLSFFGMNYYAVVVSHAAATNGVISIHESDDEPFTLPAFPWIQLTRNDFSEPFNKRDPNGGPHLDFIIESMTTTANSYGLLVNTFYELEPLYADYYNRECQPRSWSIGPLCLAKIQKNKHDSKSRWMHWLDQKLVQGSPVLYIAFGSQVRISPTQMSEIALGLEEAEVSFLWVARKSDIELLNINNNFESKVEERGMVVKEWVDQEEILEHPIVQGFLSHCGWNSVLEGICAGVPILAWPMMAEQYLNAKMVVEEIKVGLQVKTVDGTSKGFVAAGSLSSAVRELMKNGDGKRLREKAKEVAEAAKKAMAEGGSSWNALNNLITEIQKEKEVINTSKLS